MDMNKLMQQAQQMQKNMGKVQDELAAARVEIEAAGGAIKMVFSGKSEIVSLNIDPKIVDPEDADMLEDLLLTAFQEGQKKASELAEKKMSGATGGMGSMPGLF